MDYNPRLTEEDLEDDELLEFENPDEDQDEEPEFRMMDIVLNEASIERATKDVLSDTRWGTDWKINWVPYPFIADGKYNKEVYIVNLDLEIPVDLVDDARERIADA